MLAEQKKDNLNACRARNVMEWNSASTIKRITSFVNPFLTVTAHNAFSRKPPRHDSTSILEMFVSIKPACGEQAWLNAQGRSRNRCASKRPGMEFGRARQQRFHGSL
jgi:hypothetical protein